MRDRTYIIIYEVYHAPCRILNILYIHCTRATRSGCLKPITVKINDLITYTDIERSRNALLFHFRSFVFRRAYIGRSTIHSALGIYHASEILLSLGQPRNAYVLRNQMCICCQSSFFVFLVIFQFRY